MPELLHLRSWTIPTAWKRMKATKWTIAFLVIAILHCAIQLSFQLDARGAHLRAFSFISYILDEAQLQSRIAVLIPGGDLYVCDEIPRGSKTLGKQCTTVWSKEIAIMEEDNAKLRALQTVVPKDQASTVFNAILAGATSAPTTAASPAPSPTVAMEVNDGTLSGADGNEGQGDIINPRPIAIPAGSGDSDQEEDGDRNLGPLPGRTRETDRLIAPQLNLSTKTPTSTPNPTPTSTFIPSPDTTDLDNMTTATIPVDSPTLTTTSPEPTLSPSPPPGAVMPILLPVTEPTSQPELTITATTETTTTSTSALLTTTEAPLRKQPPPETTVSEGDTTSTTSATTSDLTSATTSDATFVTTTTTSTSVSTSESSTSTTSTSLETSSFQSETTLSSTTVIASESTATTVAATESIASTTIVFSTSETVLTSSATRTESTAPQPTETGTPNEEQPTGEDNQEQEQNQEQNQQEQRRWLASSWHTYRKRAQLQSRYGTSGIQLDFGKGPALVKRRKGVDIDAVTTPSNMTGVQIQGLNMAPPGSVEVIYIGPECIESLYWPYQVLCNDIKEDFVFVGFELWVLILSFIAVVGRSLPHLLAVFVSHLISTGWSIFATHRSNVFRKEFDRVIFNGACGGVDLLPLFDSMRRQSELGSLISDVASLVFTAPVVWVLYNDFGCEAWKLISGSKVMNRVYRTVLALTVLIQLGLFFLVSTAALWLDQIYNGPIAPFTKHRVIYQVFFTITAVLVLPWLFMGWIAVRRAMRRTLTTFLVLCLIFLANLTAMFASDVYLLTFTNWRFFASMTVLASAIIVLVFALGLMCRVNFKHNLAYFLDHQQALEDAASAGPPPDSARSWDPEKGSPIRFNIPGSLGSPEKNPLHLVTSATSKISGQTPAPQIQKLGPVARLRSFVTFATRPRTNSTTSSFYSPPLPLPLPSDVRSRESLKSSEGTSSVSLNIRNPFEHPDDSTSVYSDGSSLVAPVRRSTRDWTDSGASTTSAVPSAVLSSLRRGLPAPESPHYTDSSRDSGDVRFLGYNGPQNNPRMLSMRSDATPLPSANLGPLERVSMFSDAGKSVTKASNEGAAVTTVRKATLKFKKGAGLLKGASNSGSLQLAQKYSFGLK